MLIVWTNNRHCDEISAGISSVSYYTETAFYYIESWPISLETV